MVVIYPGKNYDDQQEKKPDSQVYDLAGEKKRLAEGMVDVKKELAEQWRKRYAGAEIFPDKLKIFNSELMEFMLAFDRVDFYNKLAGDNKLNVEQKDALPQVVWNTVINGAWDDVSELLRDKLNVDEAFAGKISQELDKNILSKARSLSAKRPAFAVKKDQKKSMEKMPISDALKKYPKIGEQLISVMPIKLSHFPAPAKPSIKNWITDYRQSIGAQKHGTIERGNYVFQSTNARILQDMHRKKLAAVLKSLDEGTHLVIDGEKEQVVFLEKEINDRKPVAKPGKKEIVAQNEKKEDVTKNKEKNQKKESIHFSSPHKFPAEKKRSAHHFTPIGYLDSTVDRDAKDGKEKVI